MKRTPVQLVSVGAGRPASLLPMAQGTIAARGKETDTGV